MLHRDFILRSAVGISILLSAACSTNDNNDGNGGNSDNNSDQTDTVTQIGAANPGEPEASVVTHHETIPNPLFGSNIRVAESCKGVSRACLWDEPDTWLSGEVPDRNALVIIDGHVQIANRDAQAESIGVYPDGKLTFATDANTQLRVADLIVFKDGTLEIGTNREPVEASFTAEVVFRDLPFDQRQDDKEVLRGLVTIDGVVEVYGRQLDEVFIRTSTGPSSGDNVITLEQRAGNAGWRAGDIVVIPNSTQCANAINGCPDQTEDRTISAIAGNQITLNRSLQFDHPGARNHTGLLDFTPHIVNKTRNVIFRSENPDGVRGHLLLHGRSDIDIRYAEFRDLGRTDIADLGPNNQKGRYPVHAHHLIGPAEPQRNGYQYTLIGNTVDFGEENREQDRKWGISIHGSHFGLIERNVIDYASGAGMVTESGSEAGNRFSKNFVMRIIGGNGERQHDPDPTDGSKLGRAGSAYWFNGGGRNFFENNVAAAIGECVYCFGYKFDNVHNEDLQFPNNQGDDPHMNGGQTVSAYTVGLNNFVDNEAYSVPNGLTVWWECTFGNLPRDNCSSEIDSFSVWHHHRWGYYGYPTNNMTLRNFVMRGDPALLSNRHEKSIGMNFSDYMSRNLKIVNADLQNVRTAIQMPSMRGARSETTPDIGTTNVEDSYLVATIGLEVVVPASVNGADTLPPQTSVIRNVQFDSIDPSGDLETAHIHFSDDTFFRKNTSLRNDVRIFNYNSAPGARGDDLYAVPGYEPQGPDSCDARIGQCNRDLTATHPDITQGHVYPLAQ